MQEFDEFEKQSVAPLLAFRKLFGRILVKAATRLYAQISLFDQLPHHSRHFGRTTNFWRQNLKNGVCNIEPAEVMNFQRPDRRHTKTDTAAQRHINFGGASHTTFQ